METPRQDACRGSGCRKSGLRHFFEVFIAPLRLRRGQGAMQGNPCYARLFADLTRMSPNPIIASGGCGPRTPGGFSTGCAPARCLPGLSNRRQCALSPVPRPSRARPGTLEGFFRSPSAPPRTFQCFPVFLYRGPRLPQHGQGRIGGLAGGAAAGIQHGPTQILV